MSSKKAPGKQISPANFLLYDPDDDHVIERGINEVELIKIVKDEIGAGTDITRLEVYQKVGKPAISEIKIVKG